MAAQLHPFSQLTKSEILQTSNIIKQLQPADTSLIIKTITLQEPDKALALEYLQAEHEQRDTRPKIDRHSFVAYYRKGHVNNC
jgi:Cu2+-containing amine oxidase